MRSLILITLLTISCLIGCSSRMYRVHYQINAPEFTAPPNQGETIQAVLDARSHAQQDYQGDGFCLGGGCGLFGVAGAYIYEGGIPIHRLAAIQEKSQMYQLFYREAYTKEIKRRRTTDAVGGWLGIVFIMIMIYSATVE
jgi:hypothetical protein